MLQLPRYTQKQVEALINKGHSILICHDYVLRLDEWANYHPGGVLPIMHMVGKDATDPISVWHSPDVVRRMSRFRIGQLDAPWINVQPPLSPNHDRRNAKDNGPDKSRVDGSGHNGDRINGQLFGDSRPDGNHLSLPATCEWLAARSIASRLQADDKCTGRDEVLQILRQHEVDIDLKEYPPLDATSQRLISDAFQRLHESVRQQGLYVCKLSSYAKDIARYSLLFGLFVCAFGHGWHLVSAIFLGLFWHQIMFSAHDAGHVSITHNSKCDTAIGIFIANFCCGLSIGWWKSSHNVHHLVPNHIEHDPDIQNVPLFATSASFWKSVQSTYYGCVFQWDAVATFLTGIQRYTYYPVMCLARFNLYFLSWAHLISEKAARLPNSTWTRPLELLCILCYWYWFGYYLVWRSLPTWSLRVAFVLVSHIVTMPLHVQITLSHWGMSTADIGCLESFAQRQLRTTMDVDCPAWLDFIHGGLQFQAVHHLFPRIPRHNLRETQALVRKFCDETRLRYTIFGFVDGNKVVLGRLGEIMNQLNILLRCQTAMRDGRER